MTAHADEPATVPRPWLVADIGGTNARFGWVADEPDARQPAVVTHVQTLQVADHADPTAAASFYLANLARSLGAAYVPPRAAAWGMATAVGDDRVALTNAGWSFSRRAAQRDLGLEVLLVLNDFEALALSLPRLGALQTRPIGMPAGVGGSRRGGALAVIGPGTGLGVAGLVISAHGWIAVPGEGGHASLAAADDFEAALFAAVRHEHNHVSAERLLSGIGLPVLHRAVAAVTGEAKPNLAAEAIVERGLAGDRLAARTLDAFCALLGSFAGNVALSFGARGGVYIGGGIVPRLGERFFESQFRERFEAKGRLRPYLQAIPTALITDALAALAGAALALEQHGR